MSDKLMYYAFRIVDILRSSGYEAYYAGGCVRDYIMGNCVNDIDIACSATPEKIKKIFTNTISVGEHFGVVIVLMGGISFEVATFRCDGDYYDGRHPDKVFFTNARQDAFRRDFTINGMFYDPVRGKLIDYVGGERDIEDKVVRAIGKPVDRFYEDRIRIIRAIRFASRFGFEIDFYTWVAICSFSDLIWDVSRERVRDEFLKIFDFRSDCVFAIRLLYDSGLLRKILPELFELSFTCYFVFFGITGYDIVLRMLKMIFSLFGDNLPRGFIFSIFVFLVYLEDPNIVDVVYKRFRLSLLDRKLILAILKDFEEFDFVFNMRESQLKRFLRKDNFYWSLEFYRLYCVSNFHDIYVYDFCKTKLHQWQDSLNPKLLINGNDLKNLGFKPGFLFRYILNDIENQQLEGRIDTQVLAYDYVINHFMTAYFIFDNSFLSTFYFRVFV